MSAGELNPVNVAKFPDTLRLGVWPRMSTSLKSGSSCGGIGYFALKLKGMASGDAVPVSILYAPEFSPFDELVNFVQIELEQKYEGWPNIHLFRSPMTKTGDFVCTASYRARQSNNDAPRRRAGSEA